MVRQILQQCTSCKQYCLEVTCVHCGGRAQAAAPLKWSPEDHRASVRRKLNNVESDEWVQLLPTLQTPSVGLQDDSSKS